MKLIERWWLHSFGMSKSAEKERVRSRAIDCQNFGNDEQRPRKKTANKRTKKDNIPMKADIKQKTQCKNQQITSLDC